MPTSLAAAPPLADWATAIRSQPASSATAEAERTVMPDPRSNPRRRRSII
jgi:hypothetical protein